MDSDQTYCFVVEWFDDIAEIARAFRLTFWPKDNSVSMFDMGRRRVFLKRIVVESIRLCDLFVGQKVVICSRQLVIKEYGDSKTREYFGEQMKSAILVFQGRDVFAHTAQFLCSIPNNVSIAGLRSIRVDQAVNQLCSDLELSSTAVSIFLTGENAASFVLSWHEENASTRLVENTSENIACMLNAAPTSAQISNCTLCVIKPHALVENQAGGIVNKIVNSSFSISAMQMFQLSPQEAEHFYEVYKGVVKQYSDILFEFLSGPVIALEIVQRNDENVHLQNDSQGDIVGDFRNLVGPHDPHVAKHIRSHTIRAEFGKSRVQNGVHCTDLSDDGILECEYFFRALQKQ